MDNTYRHIFTTTLAEVKAERAAYDADVTDWYENGEGASPDWQTDINEEGEVIRWNAGGSGYTYPYCIHGVSRWVDYDCACGACEESYTDLQIAQFRARRTYREWKARSEWVLAAPASLGSKEREVIIAWMLEVWPSGK